MRSDEASPLYPNFIKEWRKYRKMTQVQLLEGVERLSRAAIGTGASLSRIEAGIQNTTLETLSCIATVLGTDMAKLLSLNPLEDRKPKRLWETLGERDQDRLERSMGVILDLTKSAGEHE